MRNTRAFAAFPQLFCTVQGRKIRLALVGGVVDQRGQLVHRIELAHRAEIFVKFQHRLLTVDIAGEVRHKRLAGHGGVFTAVHRGALADAGGCGPPLAIQINAGQVDARAGLQSRGGVVLVQRRRAELSAADALAADNGPVDGVRMGMMLAAPAGNDILFDDALCEQGRNFNNKIWNAFRLVKGWEVADIAQPEYARLATEWFESMLAKTAAEVADLFGKYRLSEALMAVYKLFWDEFSSWYLEMIKPAYGQPIDKATYEKTLGFFDNLLKLLHPFMPFITEELWQHIYDRKEGESLMVQQLNIPTACNEIIVKEFEAVKEVIGGIRTIRLQKNIAQKETLELQVVGENPVAAFNPVITKLCNLSSIEAVENKADGSGSFMVGTTEYAIPLGNLINTEEELAKLEADLKYQEGFSLPPGNLGSRRKTPSPALGKR